MNNCYCNEYKTCPMHAAESVIPSPARAAAAAPKKKERGMGALGAVIIVLLLTVVAWPIAIPIGIVWVIWHMQTKKVTEAIAEQGGPERRE